MRDYRHTNLELECFFIVRARRIINQSPSSAQHGSDGCRAGSIPLFARYRTVIASCADKCLRARTASARQALDAARATWKCLRRSPILAEPRNLSLDVMPQVSRSSRDRCPSVALEQSASFRLEISTGHCRTRKMPQGVCSFWLLIDENEKRNSVTVIR